MVLFLMNKVMNLINWYLVYWNFLDSIFIWMCDKKKLYKDFKDRKKIFLVIVSN